MNNTTIQISNPVKNALNELKIYKRETYNDVLERMLAESGLEEEKLSAKELAEVKKAEKEIAKGIAVPWREVIGE